MTTIQGELVPRDDNPSLSARRTQKIYEDILGRIYKAETLNWNGTVYSTSKSFFNGRDQVTTARQYSGSDTSSTYQDTVMTYDGHGRLYSQHRPEQNASTATVYSYYADDRVQQVTDARGATVSYTYNSRGLPTQISSTSPNTSTIPVTPTVTFSYDNIGNRTAMTDGLGNVEYEYDQLSQLTAETRQFTDNLPNAPLSNNRFKVQYSYSYSGQLKSIIDPYGQQFNYSFDKTGRLNSVTGTTFANITTYANNPNYRAWGALKSLSYGSGAQMAVSHNNRLQAESYTLTSNSTQLLQNTYQYYADGKFKYLHDTRPGYVNGIFDRLNLYDHVGRIIQGKSGGEARGETVTNLPFYLPYRQVYQYNAFDNLTQRNNLHWGTDTWQGIPNNHSYNYQNNRITNSGYQYDADGRMLFSPTIGDSGSYQYNAAGSVVFFQDYSSLPVNAHFRTYDGNGREIKRITNTNFPPTEENPTEQNIWNTAYYIRSTVLGNETLTEVDSTGKKLKTFVNASGVNLATQYIIRESGTAVETVSFNHWDESGMNFITTGYSSGDDIGILDPLGGNMGTETPYIENNNPQPVNKDNQPQEIMPNDQMYVDGQKVSCLQDGLRIGCSSLFGTTANSLFAELNGQKLPVEKINNAIWIPTDYLRDARYRETGVPRTSQWGVVDVRDLSRTGQQNDDLTEDFNNFLRVNDKCEKVLKRRGIDIRKLYRAARITDLTKDQSDLDKTKKELGFKFPKNDPIHRNPFILGKQLSGTLRDNFNDGNTNAVAIYPTNKIYVYPHFHTKTELERGMFLVHELLHIHFKDGHVRVAQGLGLNIKHDYVRNAYYVDEFGKIGNFFWLKDANDRKANDMINDWLNRNCGTQPSGGKSK